jgi:hypothetical protein
VYIGIGGRDPHIPNLDATADVGEWPSSGCYHFNPCTVGLVTKPIWEVFPNLQGTATLHFTSACQQLGLLHKVGQLTAVCLRATITSLDVREALYHI